MDYGGGGGGNAGFSSPQQQQTSSQSPQQRPRKAYDAQTLIPVTIRMLLNAKTSPDGSGGLELQEDNRPGFSRELHQVKLVAAIRSMEEQSTHVLYEVEDSTGLMEVKQWLDDNDCRALAEMRAQCVEHCYVRIIGQVKDYDGKKSVVAYRIQKVSSGNELTHHFLEVVHSSLKAKKAMAAGSSGGIGFGGAAAAGAAIVNARQPLAAAAGGHNSTTGNQTSDDVLDFIRAEGQGDVGVEITKIAQGLGGKYTLEQIRTAINGLAGEGHLYSTINDDWYKFAA